MLVVWLESQCKAGASKTSSCFSTHTACTAGGCGWMGVCWWCHCHQSTKEQPASNVQAHFRHQCAMDSQCPHVTSVANFTPSDDDDQPSWLDNIFLFCGKKRTVSAFIAQESFLRNTYFTNWFFGPLFNLPLNEGVLALRSSPSQSVGLQYKTWPVRWACGQCYQGISIRSSI